MDSGRVLPLPSTDSSQQLMIDTLSINTASQGSPEIGEDRSSRQYETGLRSIRAREWGTVAVLCFVNLINYMDRFTIAGVLVDIQSEFKQGNDGGGLLQTAFVISYMIFAPLFGYLGDRYSRKWIMILGVALWSGTTLAGSYMTNFYWFLAFRAMVGVGEASYSTIAPTLLSDMFVNDIRSKMLALFYFAIPVGSGLGYIVGSEIAHLAGSWRWALRATPVLGVLACVFIFFSKEPQRGHSEGSHNLETTSYKEDLKDLIKNPTFMLSSAGFTCVAFVTGALAWWGPTFIHYGLKMQPGNENITINEVSFIFGAITMVSGIIGVPLGTILAQHYRKKYARIDPIICGCGLLISSPLILGAILVVSASGPAAYILVFFGELALNLNWAIVADILLYVVIPTRRSTAEAFQILMSHMFGDAGSPYLVGLISEAVKASLRVSNDLVTTFVSSNVESLALTSNDHKLQYTNDTDENEFKALQYALFSTTFVEVIGGVFFLIAAYYVVQDKAKAEKAVSESQQTEYQAEENKDQPQST